jgi:hypothetical protein
MRTHNMKCSTRMNPRAEQRRFNAATVSDIRAARVRDRRTLQGSRQITSTSRLNGRKAGSRASTSSATRSAEGPRNRVHTASTTGRQPVTRSLCVRRTTLVVGSSMASARTAGMGRSPITSTSEAPLSTSRGSKPGLHAPACVSRSSTTTSLKPSESVCEGRRDQDRTRTPRPRRCSKASATTLSAPQTTLTVCLDAILSLPVTSSSCYTSDLLPRLASRPGAAGAVLDT